MEDPKCVASWMRVGLSKSAAERACYGQKSRQKSDPSKPFPPGTKFPRPALPTGSPMPVGATTSSRVSRLSDAVKRPLATISEFASMSGSQGSGWKFRTGNLGSGAVVFPDSDKAAKDFLKSLQRPLTARDRSGWLTYANRLGMAPGAAERAWKAMMKPSLRPKLAEVKKDFDSVFEAASWYGYSGPHALQVKTNRGGFRHEPPPSQSSQKHKGYTDIQQKAPQPGGKRSEPKPSFPFNTRAAREVWAKAEEFVGLFPLENPTQILRRAMEAARVRPLNDLTPEDEKLLRMAIDHAQNGAPPNVAKSGGLPGGPFNSTGFGHFTKGKGAP